MSLLGVDVGTSALKAAAFNAESGAAIARARRDYPMSIPAPGLAELHPETVWAAFMSAVRDIAATPAVRHDPIRALACSASGDEIALLDAAGRALGPVILSGDTRGAAEAAEIEARLDAAALTRRTGLPLYPVFPLVRLLWYRRHAPALLDRAATALGWAEYLMLRLGLSPVADEPSAARWLLWDLERRAWLPDILTALGLPAHILPPAAPCGTRVGEISAGVGAELGLTAGVAVVTGGFDQVCAATGAGVLHPGDASVGTGTWEALTVPVDSAPVPAAIAQGYQFGAYVQPGSGCAMAINAGGGSLLKWLQGILGGDDSGEGIAALVEGAPERVSDLLVLPHWQGSTSPRMDPHSRGAVVGLTWATSRGELVRGILEGITFQLRTNLDGLRALGLRVERVRNTGGGARSPAWAQLKADILELPVETVNIEETGCLAAALLAGLGTGVYRALDTPLARFVRVTRRYDPHPERAPAYADRYRTWRNLYPALAPLSYALHM